MDKTLISKPFIEQLKIDKEAFHSFIRQQNAGMVVCVLEKLGRLDASFDEEPLIDLLKNQNENVRALTLKNLAKLSDISLLETFREYAHNDPSTIVRREAASAIGRLRNEEAIPTLIELLKDPDPKVVMQAIRGLLVFKSKLDVVNNLRNLLAHHPNELIQEVIDKELNGIEKTATNNQKHDEFPKFLKNTVVHGDVREVLKHVPDDSIHLTFTSPPYYNARDYSIYQSYEEYLDFLEDVFRAVHRVTKEGRFFVLNTSPVIIPRISRSHSSKRYPIPYDIHPRLVKMGWDFIDDIVWLKPEASAKNRNAGFLQHRKPLGYKPNSITEMLMVYRKKSHKLIDWNMKQYSQDKIERSKVNGEYETSNVWKIDPTFDRIHSAVFPLELCNKVIKFYSLVEDLVFDPFAGSGTLGRAALNLQRYFFLVEKETQYIERIKEEINKSTGLFLLKDSKPNIIDINTFIKDSKL